MEEGETVSILSRKELRKQKLMEYLAAKGKLKQSKPKPHVGDDSRLKRPTTSAFKAVTGKENKAPADSDNYDCTKVLTLTAQSTIHPARRKCGASDKVIGKSSTLIRQRMINDPPAASDPLRPKLNKNNVLTRIHTIPSSKSNMNAACHLKKQPNTGIQSSGRASSHAPRTAVSKSNGRFSTSSSAPWSRPILTVSARMSLGPIVKTKTGLVPAVTQPRHSQSQNLIHTSVAKEVRSSTSSSVAAAKRSTKPQTETLRTTSRNNPVNQKAAISSTGRTGAKVQDQNKFISKPLLGRHSQSSCRNQLQKLTSGSSKCTAAPLKPNGTAGVSKASRSGGQPTDRSAKLRCESAGEKNGQPRKVASRTSSGPESRPSSRAVSTVLQGPAADLGAKTKTCQRTDSKKGRGSANPPPPPPQTAIKRTVAPLMSQTVPRPARTISHTGRAADMKTPKVPVRVIPQTEGKRLTADQEERMKKLQEWREARGISYKRPPMPVKSQVRRTVAVPQPFWATMKDEDEAHSLICAVDRSLADCIKLLGEGCSPDQVKEVLSRLPPVSQKFAKYWICRARLMEQEGNLDVLPMFEEAVGVVLEPVDELRTVVFEILKKKDEIQALEENGNEEDRIPAGECTPESINNPMMTPKPVRALICGEKGDSSVVKYKITATPSGPPSQQKQPVRVNGQEVRFFTPVRRSVRIERASLRYPASLQDHDLCVASYDDLISEEDRERGGEEESEDTSPSPSNTPMYVYRENEALKDKVVVRLVCDESV